MQDETPPTIRTAAQQTVEARFGRPVTELLKERLVDRGLTQVETAAELGIHEATVQRWMADLGLIIVRRGGERILMRSDQAEATA
jgi:predicted transcriptional regulator